jgi:hypothetical protein
MGMGTGKVGFAVRVQRFFDFDRYEIDLTVLNAALGDHALRKRFHRRSVSAKDRHL